MTSQMTGEQSGGNSVEHLKHLLDLHVTELKQAKREAAELAKRLDSLNANLAHVMVYQLSSGTDGASRRFTYISPVVEKFHGVTVEEAMKDASLVYKTLLPEDLRMIQEQEAEALREQKRFDFIARARLPSGEIRWRSFFSVPRREANGELLWDGIEFDITELKKAEEALQRSQATILSVFEACPVGICIMKNRLYVRANRCWCETFGYTEETLIGKSPRMLYETDEEWERVGRELYHNTRTISLETRLRRSDGAFRDVILIAAPISPGDPDQGAVVIIRDVTEKKKAAAERDLMQARLIQAQKLESVGRLAGGVAHDFNNMLGVILGHVEMCLDIGESVQGQKMYGNLLEIRRAAEHSATLTRQLLAFARKQTMRPTVLDLNATIENLLTMMRRLIGENIELEWKPKAGLWPVHMDPSQIDQILTNLCVNARDAISTAGRISVLTENVSLDAAACAGRHDASAGDYVVISVTDTGSGISEAVRQHIFEPFFTTKEIGKGTGLGLATIYGIVTQNKGFIDVDSAPGRETTFRIHIPRHNVPAPPEQEDTKAKGPVRGHGKILLVEDDPGLLQICTLMLERVGYTVLPASAPTMALNLAHNSAINLDALVTDVIMPEGNGVELARKIRAIRPGLKCLFMSGYANDVVSREQIPKDTEFIQKPFSTAALAEKLGRMLNSANVSP